MFIPTPRHDLTPAEINVLKAIQCGEHIPNGAGAKLELYDLARKRPRGWMLTATGEYRLSQGR
jgi:hypothetical protein